MMLPKIGDLYPRDGAHAGHAARIVRVDTHGFASYEDGPGVPAPTLTVVCACGDAFRTRLPEAVAAA